MTEMDVSSEDFFDAIDNNDFAKAAAVLRALPSLQRLDLDLLADLFDPNLPKSALDHYQVYRVQRKPGGPRRARRGGRETPTKPSERQNQVCAEDFFDAINSNDLAVAAEVLRELPSLQGKEVNRLADLFDPDPASPFNRYKLRRKQRKVGRPSDPWRKGVRRTNIDWAVNRAYEEAYKREGPKQWEAAVVEVMAAMGIQRSAVFAACKKAKRHS
jgi:hypothetical protein